MAGFWPLPTQEAGVAAQHPPCAVLLVPFMPTPAETLKGAFSPAVAGASQFCGVGESVGVAEGWGGVSGFFRLGEASTEPGKQPFLSLPLSKGRQGKTCFYK